MLGERWLTAWVLLAAALWPRYAAIPEEDDAGSDQGVPSFEEIEDLRSRYSAVQISRDSEHIKRDLSRVLLFAKEGNLDTEETTFYFMRMHDYDDNNQLDGPGAHAGVRPPSRAQQRDVNRNEAGRDGGQPDVRGRQRRRSRLLSRVAGLHQERESQGAGEH
ncbi:hypothetical protein MTO96_000807 [Rhipicephalus appendiculatus]